MSLEAIKGSLVPFDPRIHAVRGHPGQIDVARVIRELVQGSAILASHADCGRVQDPYSIRCQPQVMGACLDNLRHAARVLEIESNAVCDNPLVFAEDDAVLSGGNFHAEPVAFVCDLLALVLAEIGALSERRIALLVDANLSGLPPFLVRDGGLNSGFMIAHVTAAALASDNKALASPHSVDSLPTSANQEDHVSMATNAARRLGEMVENTATIVGIEAMAAAQGIEFHRPLASSAALEETLRDIRERVAFYEHDRFLAPDIEAMKRWVLSAPAHPQAKAILPSTGFGGRHDSRLEELNMNAPQSPTGRSTHTARVVRAPRGSTLTCKAWTIEAAYRMLQNNLDPEVAERPEDLVVYGGIGRAARNWECFDQILAALRELERRRIAPDPVRQAGRRVPHPCRRAARADRQLEPGPALGELGPLQRAGPQRADDVRADDGGLVDLHRLAGHRPGHLRNLLRGRPPALRRRSVAAGGSSRPAWAAWAAPSRWPGCSPAPACWRSSARRAASISACAPATSTARPPRSTKPWR